MVSKKKTRKTARGAGSGTQMRLLNAMNEVWLAGLGAVAKAQRSTPKGLGAFGVDVLNANIDKLARKSTGNNQPPGRKATSVSGARP